MCRASRLAPLGLAALLIAVAGCQRPGPEPPAGPANSTAARTAGKPAPTGDLVVRVGYFPNVTHAPAVLGLAQGGAIRAALAGKASLVTRTFNAGPAAMEALHARALDLCFVGPTPAINAFARGGDLVIVANVANGGSTLVARKDAGIRTVADLAGRKIAVPQLGNTQDAMLRDLLVRQGIKLAEQGGKTTVSPVPNPDVMGLFERKELDAACVPEPWGARLELEAGAVPVLDWKAIWRHGDYPVTVLVARKEYLQAHPEVVGVVVKALQASISKLAANPAAQAAALNAELKVLTNKTLKPEVITAALKRMTFSATPNPAALKAMAQVMKDVGYAKTVPDISGLVDSQFLKAAPEAAAK
jgi:NitT/TauT family transport system substrate-binding protein